MKNLIELIAQIPIQCHSTGNLNDIEFQAINNDSRTTQPGDVFFAMQGGSFDGHQYIGEAKKRGAIAVVGTRSYQSEWEIPYIQVDDSREALGWFCAALEGFPARKLGVIGVTGTDGKTTTCNLLYQILKEAGIKTGMISTVNAIIGEEEIDTGFHVTTPDAPLVQSLFSRMLEAGITHVILESTSHGLAQHRVTSCEFDIGVVTNITHEHLDYHGSYDAYLSAKGRLFEILGASSQKPVTIRKLAVLNSDDSSLEPLKSVVKSDVKTYSINTHSDYQALGIDQTPDGTKFSVVHNNVESPIESPLLGTYNVLNNLAAYVTAVEGLAIDPSIAAKALSKFQGVPGRMERINMGQSFTAIVDFAHTPNALKVTLETIREFTKGRILAVFGSAGLRDREKRKMMAAVSTKLADVSYFTAEDPRTESLDDILNEMASEAIHQGGEESRTFFRVPDRAGAILRAIKDAKPGDVVVACGKGHEQSMCFGTIEYAWDDRTAMKASLAEILNIPGPKMPFLPTSK